MDIGAKDGANDIVGEVSKKVRLTGGGHLTIVYNVLSMKPM